jgi:hypothetical protein
MSELGWIVALRIWNKDAPSWCVPRKNTEGYKAVQRIRKGEKIKTAKELIAELEKKTEKPKVVRKTIRISLDKPAAEGGKSLTETNVAKETEKEMKMKTKMDDTKEVKASEMKTIPAIPDKTPREETIKTTEQYLARLRDLAKDGKLYRTVLSGARPSMSGESIYYVRDGDTVHKIARVSQTFTMDKDVPMWQRVTFYNVRAQSYPISKFPDIDQVPASAFGPAEQTPDKKEEVKASEMDPKNWKDQRWWKNVDGVYYFDGEKSKGIYFFKRVYRKGFVDRDTWQYTGRNFRDTKKDGSMPPLIEKEGFEPLYDKELIAKADYNRVNKIDIYA